MEQQFERAQGLAIDQSTGDLLVQVESGAILRFNPDGTPANFSALATHVIDGKKGPGAKPCAEEPSSCDETPQGSLRFGTYPSEQQITVDNSGGITDGDIYVTQGKQAAGNLVDVFASSGKYLGQLTAAGSTAFGTSGSFQFSPIGVAVDSSGDLFLGGGYDNKVYKFVPTTNPPQNSDYVASYASSQPIAGLAVGAGPSAGSLFANTFFTYEGNSVLKLSAISLSFETIVEPVESRLVAVDPSNGRLYVASVGVKNNGDIGGEINEYSPSGSLLSTFSDLGSQGIAAGNEQIYVSKGTRVQVYGPLVTVPDVTTGEASPTGDTSLELTGTVNPDGVALEECRFQYGLTEAYGHSVPCAESLGEIGLSTHAVHVEVGELAKETLYHYRLVARNENATIEGKDATIKTPSKPAISEEWASQVGLSEATLKAKINPEHSATTYRLEWGLDSSYGNVTAEKAVGANAASHTVSTFLPELQPATTYHWHVVATNGIGVTEGPDRAFTTFAPPRPPGENCSNQAFRGGRAADLPDCRAYEMVSPLDKEGGEIFVLQTPPLTPAVLSQSSADGERFVYGSYRAFGGADSAPYTSQYVAARGESGWASHSILPPRTRVVVAPSQTQDTELKQLSPDLCEAWIRNLSDPPQAGGLPGYVNIYRRQDEECGGPAYEALTVEPEFLVDPPFAPSGSPLGLVFEGGAREGGAAIYLAIDNLSADAPPQPAQCVEDEGGVSCLKRLYYRAAGGAPHFACVLPDGRPFAGACSGGASALGEESVGETRSASLQGAISGDGSRVFWTAAAKGAGKVYLRENPGRSESTHLHGTASGKGDMIGPAKGTGNLISGSTKISAVVTESGTFAVGQEVTGTGIPAKDKITAIAVEVSGALKLTLEKAAGASQTGVELSGVGSEVVSSLSTESGAFAVGQEVSAANEGIPFGTTITSCSPSCGPSAIAVTLSAKATKTASGVGLEASSECTEAAKACTVAASAEGEALSGAQSSFFWGASANGDRMIYETQQAGGGNGDIYQFDTETGTSSLIVHESIGLLGMSDDASWIYLASKEVLSGANGQGKAPVAGGRNLYALHEGTFRFVATLKSPDPNQPGFEAVTPRPISRAAYVSGDGAHAAFMAQASLTGYDNADAVSGEADAEVFVYDASADEGMGRLSCASCNPSGQRPTGSLVKEGAPNERWAAGILPIWETSLYAPRPLSADGSRLFFESTDALSLRDTNGARDVYEWEAPGHGSCEEGASDYSAQNEGCVDLISSGQNPGDSRLLDVSPEGRDAFFTTAASLIKADYGLVDVYDARVEGGLPEPPEPAAQCEGEACQGTPEAPNDPTPASESFEGAGNVHEEAVTQRPKPKPCGKGKVKRHGKCVKRHKRHAKKKHSKHKRRARHSRRAVR